MGKKVGVLSAIFLGLVLLCCCGGLYFARSFFSRIKEVQSKDEQFVKTALTATAKNWDEKDFSIYADDSFNKPGKREQTRKDFALLKQKLGSLVSLGTVNLKKTNGFRSTSGGADNGLFLTFVVKAKFEKRDGVFEVTVRNNRDHQAIYAIDLSPDNSIASESAGNNAH